MVTYHSRVPALEQPKPDPIPRNRFLGFTAGRIDTDGFLIGWDRGSIRLLVFQPGTTSAERLKVAVYSWLAHHTANFMVATMIAWILLFRPLNALPVDLVSRLMIIGAAGIGLVLALTGIAWAFARRTLATSHGIVCRARTFRLSEPRGGRIYETKIVAGDKELFEEYSAQLRSLEARELSPMDHEREWAQIYNDLEAITASATAPKDAAA